MKNMMLEKIVQLAGENALLRKENGGVLNNATNYLERLEQVKKERGEMAYKLEITETKVQMLQEKNNQLIIDCERLKKMLKAAEAEIKRLGEDK